MTKLMLSYRSPPASWIRGRNGRAIRAVRGGNYRRAPRWLPQPGEKTFVQYHEGSKDGLGRFICVVHYAIMPLFYLATVGVRLDYSTILTLPVSGSAWRKLESGK